ncbi:putative transporter [uncultured Roseburia sp.]|uniref:MFS transporter n=1 Tax=Brotonthovivens ammoniilytica TaxID=2981725 RepID=A0ABT2TJP3_9FIRM|nr:MFS transporter [Brotonthovivens ammoniilytica]MCU6762442.1 MFS transporter [Brotonthovivens ammoniilytica]SCI71844.1 putative transporter [uncultured Roseburia sp.]
MEQKKVRGYGVRGWVLIIWIATAFLAYTAVGNYPLNILSELYGGQQALSTIYTVASVIGVIVQLIASSFIGRLRSVKKLGCLMGLLTIIFLLGIMFIPGYIPGGMQMLWRAVYGIGTVCSVMYGTFALSILVGQWFPTRKGGVMGIATFAFPIGNGVIGAFAATAFKGGTPHVALAFAPFLIIFIIGWIIGLVFVPDYPEEVGAYRDNNADMTPEMAKAMMEEEIENKKTTVWKLNHTLTTRDFWFITLPAGLLLMFSVGTMTQTNQILAQMGDGLDKYGGFAGVMAMIMIFGLIGSFVLGVLDQKLGTKKAMIIACVIMLIAGILGAVSSPAKPGLLVAALIFLALFMGASSNFTVSLAAQYWRREDFGTVFAAVNPIANLICAFGPMLIAILMIGSGYTMIFKVVAGAGIVSIILMLLFSSKHVKAKDDTYRKAAGKKLDNALADRK